MMRIAALFSAGAIALAGCSGGASGAAGDATSGDAQSAATVGFSAAVLDNPFTATNVNGIVDAVNADGLDMLPPTNAEGDVGKQITDMNTLISQGVKAMVIIPRDSDAIIPGIEAANTAGVPVVTVDTAANGGKIYMNVRADNVDMGEKACQELGKAAGGKGTVLQLFGPVSTTPGADRKQGFEDCMTKNFPAMEILSKDTGWDSTQAVDQAQTVLNTTPIDAIFLASDSVMLAGVQTVLEGLDKWKPVGTEGHVPMVAIDGSAPALQAIRDGYLDADVSQPLNLYATYSVYYVKAAIAGETFKVGPSDHNSEIVDYKGNLADMLPSTIATKDNVEDDSLWGNAAA
jgi:ABC-type sugar transport system substrate-binding protein